MPPVPRLMRERLLAGASLLLVLATFIPLGEASPVNDFIEERGEADWHSEDYLGNTDTSISEILNDTETPKPVPCAAKPWRRLIGQISNRNLLDFEKLIEEGELDYAPIDMKFKLTRFGINRDSCPKNAFLRKFYGLQELLAKYTLIHPNTKYCGVSPLDCVTPEAPIGRADECCYLHDKCALYIGSLENLSSTWTTSVPLSMCHCNLAFIKCLRTDETFLGAQVKQVFLTLTQECFEISACGRVLYQCRMEDLCHLEPSNLMETVEAACTNHTLIGSLQIVM